MSQDPSQDPSQSPPQEGPRCPECGEPQQRLVTAEPDQAGVGGRREDAVHEAWGCANPHCDAFQPQLARAEQRDEAYAEGRATHATEPAESANEPTGGEDIGA